MFKQTAAAFETVQSSCSPSQAVVGGCAGCEEDGKKRRTSGTVQRKRPRTGNQATPRKQGAHLVFVFLLLGKRVQQQRDKRVQCSQTIVVAHTGGSRSFCCCILCLFLQQRLLPQASGHRLVTAMPLQGGGAAGQRGARGRKACCRKPKR